MTEIQFLALLLLDDSVSLDLKKKLIDRIVEIENLKTVTPQSITITQTTPECQHTYPQLFSGTMPPSCTKCGKAMYPYLTTVTSGSEVLLGGVTLSNARN
jgi:hypothetical protein